MYKIQFGNRICIVTAPFDLRIKTLIYSYILKCLGRGIWRNWNCDMRVSFSRNCGPLLVEGVYRLSWWCKGWPPLRYVKVFSELTFRSLALHQNKWNPSPAVMFIVGNTFVRKQNHSKWGSRFGRYRMKITSKVPSNPCLTSLTSWIFLGNVAVGVLSMATQYENGESSWNQRGSRRRVLLLAVIHSKCKYFHLCLQVASQRGQTA